MDFFVLWVVLVCICCDLSWCLICCDQVFDGHGGPEAAAFIRKNVLRLFFEDVSFPPMPDVDEVLPEEIESLLRKAFLLADQALADDSGVSNSSGTTALTALVLGRYAFPPQCMISFIPDSNLCICGLSLLLFVYLPMRICCRFRLSSPAI